MLSISNKDVLDYCKKGDNTLAAAVNFSLSGNSLTVTDATTYAAGDSREKVNITVFDNFGAKKEYQILSGSAGGAITIDLAADGFNKAEGLSMIATVVSANGKVKDGSVVNTFALSGAFTMEK